MSLRPEISGFSLATLRSFVGSGDPSVAERAAEHTRDMYNDADEIVDHVRAIVLGTTGPVEIEDQSFIYAVVALAHFDQEHLETNSNLYKSVFSDWVLELDREPDNEAGGEWERTVELLEWALLARPLFGTEQDSDWTTYGYLTNEEVRRLLAYRARFPQLVESADEDHTEFAEDFFGWLEKIRDAGLDYFFYAQ